ALQVLVGRARRLPPARLQRRAVRGPAARHVPPGGDGRRGRPDRGRAAVLLHGRRRTDHQDQLGLLGLSAGGHTAPSRYAGIADWYDAEFATSELGASARAIALRLLGEGPGRLLDVGCGGGAHAAALAEHGWSVTGVDVSAAQLELARRRGVDVVEA